jgi:hypothetical protein
MDRTPAGDDRLKELNLVPSRNVATILQSMCGELYPEEAQRRFSETAQLA